MSKVNALIEALSAAKIGSDQLDVDVMEVLGLIHADYKEIGIVRDLVLWTSPQGQEYRTNLVKFTRSLDATEKFLPKEWYWENMKRIDPDGENETWSLMASEYLVPSDGGAPENVFDVVEGTLPIARTIVLLKAAQIYKILQFVNRSK